MTIYSLLGAKGTDNAPVHIAQKTSRHHVTPVQSLPVLYQLPRCRRVEDKHAVGRPSPFVQLSFQLSDRRFPVLPCRCIEARYFKTYKRPQCRFYVPTASDASVDDKRSVYIVHNLNVFIHLYQYCLSIKYESIHFGYVSLSFHSVVSYVS